uniref:Uncharacterized protein n=1 Tax=Peronospora matthiolae TaxID=2874970 RepID=A0AAV1TCZ1_9STRA
MRCAAKAAEKTAAEKAAASVNAAAIDVSYPVAADDALSAAANLPEAPIAAESSGVSPRANDNGFQVEHI